MRIKYVLMQNNKVVRTTSDYKKALDFMNTVNNQNDIARRACMELKIARRACVALLQEYKDSDITLHITIE